MRVVTGTIVRPDGSPVAHAHVTFILTDLFGRIVNSYDEARRIASRAKTLTDENGRFSIAVLENDVTGTQTAYLVRVDDPDVRDCPVVVGRGEDAIDLVDLLRYGRPEIESFEGSVYTTYPMIDGKGYRFDCEAVAEVIDFLGGGSGLGKNPVVPEFAKYFVAYEDGVWNRDDMAAFDALLTKMVKRDITCEAIENGG